MKVRQVRPTQKYLHNNNYLHKLDLHRLDRPLLKCSICKSRQMTFSVSTMTADCVLGEIVYPSNSDDFGFEMTEDHMSETFDFFLFWYRFHIIR